MLLRWPSSHLFQQVKRPKPTQPLGAPEPLGTHPIEYFSKWATYLCRRQILVDTLKRMTGTKKSGLGRGLSSLIPTSQTEEENNLDGNQRVLRSMVDASFELIAEHHEVSLAAYLHAPVGEEPMFFLHRPVFSTLTPTTAFRLFHQVAQLSNAATSIGPFALEEWNGIYLRSSGEHSDGIHLFARTGEGYDPETVNAIARVNNAASSVVHQVESVHESNDLPPVRLVVEVEDAKTTVEATITAPNGSLRQGRGSAILAEEAVIRAILDAMGTALRFETFSDVPVDNGRAILTTLSESNGTPRFGLATGGADNLSTAASSALRALR